MPDTPPPPVAFSKPLLPQTSFAMRANLPAREPEWVERWLREGVYEKLLAKRREENAPTYIVHLGPPYANGNFHMGHLLTYVLKDFVVRHKFMSGFASPYAPGWDCHGLPIEWKIETELREKGQTKQSISLTELRGRCRAYAQKWSDVQLTEWQRLGALADWKRPYRTMDKANEAGIVHCLGELVQRGLVYKKLRSTLWAPVEETALAEAEIEYDEHYKSTAVYVALKVARNEERGSEEHLVIWTTTPWTLPANRAVAVKADEDYVVLIPNIHHTVHPTGDEQLGPKADKIRHKKFIVAKACKEAFLHKLSDDFSVSQWTEEKLIKGQDLLGLTYNHPLYAGRTGTVYHGDHVTTDSGTGMVHIAPAHGMEDFQLGEKHGLDTTCPVNGSGRYEDFVEAGLPDGLTLKGRSVLDKKVTEDILKALGGKLLHASIYEHKYPLSWRSKAPVIYRTTEQWFIDLDKAIPQLEGQSVRERSLDLIHKRNGNRGVNWVPEYGENRIGSMIAGRPDWCISRQRAWGVPITIMLDKKTGEMVTDAAVWQHIESLVAAEGIDAWDTRLGGKEAELFPAGWLQANGKTPADFTYVRDILDVWFDSGTTWSHVVKADSAKGQRFERNDGKRVADLYQEGSDQHRGWFHSSLLTSVALTGDAPYESVVTSGFVVDGQGRKFSKSLGNGVAPSDLLGKYGMDILRLWVASSDYSEDIRYSPNILDAAADTYRSLRNTLRWLLGNLPENGGTITPVAPEAMPELEHYILHRLGVVLEEVKKHYDGFQFHHGLRVLQTFCSTELSNFYFDVRKDVLYCDRADSPTRVACVAALEVLFKGLTTHLAPFLPFTSDEAWRCRYGETECVHMEEFAVTPKIEINAKRWKDILAMRDSVNSVIEEYRQEGKIGPNLEVSALKIRVWDSLLEDKDGPSLRAIFGVSGCEIQNNGKFDDASTQQAWAIKPEEMSIRQGHKCPRCWRYYEALVESGLCARCEEAQVRE